RHDAASDLGALAEWLQLFLALVTVVRLQRRRETVATKTVRERIALLAQRRQFLATLGNQLVLILRRRVLFVSHVEFRWLSAPAGASLLAISSALRAGRLRGKFLQFLQASLQRGLDKLVQVAIEHALGVARFHAGTQILDARVIEHIGTNLAAPADIRLGFLQLLLGGIALLRSEEHT